MIPDRLYIVCGFSAVLIIAGFFLVGAHHEIKHRLRQRRHGGYLIGRDR